MYGTGREPAWRRDVAWASAVLATLLTVALVLLVTLAQLSAGERGRRVQSAVLRLTLAPTGEPTLGGIGVRTTSGYAPGEALELLPGIRVEAAPAELDALTPEASLERISVAATELLLSGGRPALDSLLAERASAEPLALAAGAPAEALLLASLGEAFAGGGLDDGSRLAQWRTQAAANPGQNVQPLVGVFVRFPPAELRSLSNSELGAEVTAVLAREVLTGGLAAALELISNENLRARLTRGVESLARARLEELFLAVLSSRGEEVAARLDEARSVNAGASGSGELSAGALTAAELEGLTESEAQERIIAALAEGAHAGGSAAAAAQLTNDDQAARVNRAAPVIDAFSAPAHSRYVTLAWLTGAAWLLLLLLLALLSRGLLRLVNPALVLLLGGGAGAYASMRAGTLIPASAPAAPQGPSQQGAFAALSDLVTFVAGSLPADALELPLRNYLAAGALGAALLLLAALSLLVRSLRPRRRRW